MPAEDYWDEMLTWENTSNPLNPGGQADPYFVAYPLPPNPTPELQAQYDAAMDRVKERLVEMCPKDAGGSIDWSEFQDWIHWSFGPTTESGDSFDPSGNPTRPLMNNGGMWLWVNFCQRTIERIPTHPPGLVGAAADAAADDIASLEIWTQYLKVVLEEAIYYFTTVFEDKGLTKALTDKQTALLSMAVPGTGSPTPGGHPAGVEEQPVSVAALVRSFMDREADTATGRALEIGRRAAAIVLAVNPRAADGLTLFNHPVGELSVEVSLTPLAQNPPDARIRIPPLAAPSGNTDVSKEPRRQHTEEAPVVEQPPAPS